MSIEVTCPSCAAKLRLPDRFARRGLICTKCQHEFRLPTVAAEALPSPRDPRAAPSQMASFQRPDERATVPQRVATVKSEAPTARRPAASRADRATSVERVPQLASDFWNEVSDLSEEGGALPPRIEPRKSSKQRKVRASKRREEESDWPYYAIGLIGFGPLLFIVQPLFAYALLSNPSLAVRRADPRAVVPGAAANQAFAGAAPGGVAGGGLFVPQVAGGQIANNGARQPPAFAPARPVPVFGGRPLPGRPNRAAEMLKQHDEWRKAAQERANAARQRMQADLAAQQPGVAGAGAGAGQPIILQQAAPNFAANPPPGANRQGVNPVPAGAAGAPVAEAEDVQSIPGLDPYVSREGQRALSIILPLWHLAMLVYLVGGMWATFVKAGRPGWAVLIPIYNGVVLFKIAEVSLWWLPTLLIPGFGLVTAMMLKLNLAAKFGKGNGFAVGLALLGPIFYPVLGYGNARYQPRQTRFASDSY